MSEALDEVIAPGCELEIVVDEREPDEEPPTHDDGGGRRLVDATREVGSLGIGPYGTALLDEAGLNPRYTFETFVKGASNQFALAAALRVAETPARSYNPLFIYGAAGLGKTHLLHAIGHYVHHNYQHHEVRYVSTETFLNEFVDAIRTNTGNAFKRRYREIDVLLIDDIQFLENREGLQEEFFHTFNSLHGANKQIVISSDRVPDAIPTLEERLRGRFKWGLITDIQPPDLETRLAILRNKAERDEVEVPPEALEFIATKVSTNIRELEGRADPGHRLRQPQPRPDHHRARPAPAGRPPARGPRRGRAPTRSCSPRSPGSSASRSPPSRARAASVRWSRPARSRCTCSASSPTSATPASPASSVAATTRRSSTPSRRSSA